MKLDKIYLEEIEKDGVHILEVFLHAHTMIKHFVTDVFKEDVYILIIDSLNWIESYLNNSIEKIIENRLKNKITAVLDSLRLLKRLGDYNV